MTSSGILTGISVGRCAGPRRWATRGSCDRGVIGGRRWKDEKGVEGYDLYADAADWVEHSQR